MRLRGLANLVRSGHVDDGGRAWASLLRAVARPVGVDAIAPRRGEGSRGMFTSAATAPALRPTHRPRAHTCRWGEGGRLRGDPAPARRDHSTAAAVSERPRRTSSPRCSGDLGRGSPAGRGAAYRVALFRHRPSAFVSYTALSTLLLPQWLIRAKARSACGYAKLIGGQRRGERRPGGVARIPRPRHGLVADGTIDADAPNAAGLQIGASVRQLSAIVDIRALLADRPPTR